jgi:hypothetical protein
VDTTTFNEGPGAWRVIGATARGETHVRAGVACQDTVGWFVGERLVIGVCADGAGSAEFGELGSRLAVEEPIARAKRANGRTSERALDATKLARQCMRGSRAYIRKVAHERGLDPNQLATTLALCVVTDQQVCFAHIGDGVSCARIKAAFVSPLAPHRGVYANETTFITSGTRLPWVTLKTYPATDVDAFCLSSDGLRLVITSSAVTGEPFRPFFADLFGFVERGGSSAGLASFLETVEERTGDDKSLVVGICPQGRPAAAP